MDEEDWIAAMQADPANAAIMGAFADWLDERNDPRAGAFRLLWEFGLIGQQERPSPRICYWGSSMWQSDQCEISSEWWCHSDFRYQSHDGVVTNRMALALSWAAASDTARYRWRKQTAERHSKRVSTI